MLKENIHMKIPEVIKEVLEEHYTYEYIFTIIKYIYGLVQGANFWFKESIKTMTLKAVLKECNIDPCILHILNELGNAVDILYIDDTP